MIRNYRELAVYQKAFEQAMRIFEVTKRFPADRQDAGIHDRGPRKVLLQGATRHLMTNCLLPSGVSRISCVALGGSKPSASCLLEA
jgi:hypothetical protein